MYIPENNYIPPEHKNSEIHYLYNIIVIFFNRKDNNRVFVCFIVSSYEMKINSDCYIIWIGKLYIQCILHVYMYKQGDPPKCEHSIFRKILV